VAGIGTASLLADVGHEVPTALLPSLLTSTLGAPAAALGLIEGVSDALAGTARFAGGALADDPGRRRRIAVGGYSSTAALAALTGAATSVWQVGVLLAGAWAARAIGCVETAQHSAVAALAPADLRGSAFGLLATIQAIRNFAASAIAGVLWTAISPTAAFLYLTAWMLVALIGLNTPGHRNGDPEPQ
jgi:nitrate/nitrite transporter NarK